MEGPRSVKPDEMPSLSQMLDTVFRSGLENVMFGEFPQLFCEQNRENLLVFVDDGKVVAHFGMTERRASISGCTVGVGCVGSVATYEEYRGQRLASQLFDKCKGKSIKDDIDFLLISGGRGLYRRAGAADFGCDHQATVEMGKIESGEALSIREGLASDVDRCQVAYHQKQVHFNRPVDDWAYFLESKHGFGGDSDFTIVEKEGQFLAYCITTKPNDKGLIHLTEFAGEEYFLASAMDGLMRHTGAKTLRLRLQPENIMLKSVMESHGIEFQPNPNPGTLLILQFEKMMNQFKPLFAQKIGLEKAEALSFKEREDDFVFISSDGEHRVEDRFEAAEFVFNKDIERTGVWAEILPVPGLWYGLNYI